jgi:hypothetical protein
MPSRPVSSLTSLVAASSTFSPDSTKPLGKHQIPSLVLKHNATSNRPSTSRKMTPPEATNFRAFKRHPPCISLLTLHDSSVCLLKPTILKHANTRQVHNKNPPWSRSKQVMISLKLHQRQAHASLSLQPRQANRISRSASNAPKRKARNQTCTVDKQVEPRLKATRHQRNIPADRPKTMTNPEKPTGRVLFARLGGVQTASGQHLTAHV